MALVKAVLGRKEYKKRENVTTGKFGKLSSRKKMIVDCLDWFICKSMNLIIFFTKCRKLIVHSDFVCTIWFLFLFSFLTRLGCIATHLSFADKVLLLFIWIVQYPTLALIVELFVGSTAVMSVFIRKGLKVIAPFFKHFIPHSFGEDPISSFLSENIIGIIDGTVHKIRRPSHDQHLWWNAHYEMHATHSLFLIAFDGRIIAIVTGILGSIHGAVAAKHAQIFRECLQSNLALGDPGFGGISYIVSGLRSNQVTTDGRKEFDRISRSEQVKIEHVNNFVKKSKSLSKTDQFIHNIPMLNLTVLIGAGWYNFMLVKFNKFIAN
jgi:hypothetical protein